MNTVALTTPAMLFPAISLLFLAYTQRFLALANLIRNLRKVELGVRFGETTCPSDHSINNRQIDSLRRRLHLMKTMQLFGVIAFILCSISMLSMFLEWNIAGRIIFGASIGSLIVSLLISLYEVWLSTGAIDIALSDMER
ncbi:DUF2721 domain-containing protein [Candidatus Pacearchaeota archaeon]|jgi:hypothetical protein|nr:DUF2721 domain-containing protein [Candidatus Pacearchaeota archaeon]